MTEWAVEASIGDRIQAARKARGVRTTRELADRMTGSTVTEAVLENIESGRKVNLEVSQVLSIAMALQVPPVFLLAPVGTPDSPLDLPNLSDAFKGMTAVQFDSWLAGIPHGSYRSEASGELHARVELDSLRQMDRLRLEIARIRNAIEVPEVLKEIEDPNSWRALQSRLEAAEKELALSRAYLQSAGWRSLK